MSCIPLGFLAIKSPSLCKVALQLPPLNLHEDNDLNYMEVSRLVTTSIAMSLLLNLISILTFPTRVQPDQIRPKMVSGLDLNPGPTH